MQVTTERTLEHRSETKAIPVPDTKTGRIRSAERSCYTLTALPPPQAGAAAGGELAPSLELPSRKESPGRIPSSHCGSLPGSPTLAVPHRDCRETGRT